MTLRGTSDLGADSSTNPNDPKMIAGGDDDLAAKDREITALHEQLEEMTKNMEALLKALPLSLGSGAPQMGHHAQVIEKNTLPETSTPVTTMPAFLLPMSNPDSK